jgi:hypothetical protein
MFIITFVCKPIAKFMLKHPLIAALVIVLLYLYIAYRCLLSAWDANYRKTATTDEITDRWQRQMAYTRRK